ncbi:MAG: cyclic nucleotide-binding/CBS domain-containing protein [Anaerolineaceae bacterium]|nr:cyclic nucleotide-binding/CBS domain-containing protein [Anaerolineaceae bacterium]MCB9098529.1 cyclic nucleotide-binding/CBS domain-containing protein [Anaerolineales bacterium]
MNIAEFIEHLHPFDTLPRNELDQVLNVIEQKEIAAGTRILEQGGAISQYLYIIQQGSVQLQRDEKPLQVLEEGEFFGFLSILSEDAPTADVIVHEDVSLLLVPGTIFRTLVNKNTFAEFFLKSLSDRLQHLLSLDSPPADESLASPVKSLIVHSLVAATPQTTVLETAQLMRESGVSCVIIQSEPPGIITDRDLRNRVLAEGRSAETAVGEVMTQPIKSVLADTPLYSALVYLYEEGIHHLPIIDRGEITGVVTTTDLLRQQAQSPFYFLKRLETLDDKAENLATYAPKLVQTVRSLFENGLNAIQIGRMVSSLNDTLVKRLLALAEKKFGPPPTPFAWVVFGSEGRSEQVLMTDQDNALIYLADTSEAKRYFANLAQYVINGLIQAGFPPCAGGYMATNWHYPLDHWMRLFRGWVQAPEPQAILEAAIFFDFRVVYGTLSLDPIEEIIVESGKYDLFLAQLARAALRFRPPLGFFGRIRQKDGLVDLKEGGIAPIVGLARVYALEAGSQSRSTIDRLADAAHAGSLSQEGAENLAETFRFLQWLRLRGQLDELNSKREPDNKIHLEQLSHLEKRYLKDAFLAIHEIQESAELRFRLAMLG